jgi:hypothetical protein
VSSATRGTSTESASKPEFIYEDCIRSKDGPKYKKKKLITTTDEVRIQEGEYPTGQSEQKHEGVLDKGDGGRMRHAPLIIRFALLPVTARYPLGLPSSAVGSMVKEGPPHFYDHPSSGSFAVASSTPPARNA